MMVHKSIFSPYASRTSWFFIVVLLGLWSFSGKAHAQSQTLVFALFSRGWPPFEMVIHGEPTGIAPDILKTILPEGVPVVTVPLPAARKYLYPTKGQVYTRLEAREWMPPGHELLWSVPVLQSRSLLYSPAQKPLSYNGPESLENKTIGCITNYRYPTLQPLFEAGRAVRYNVNSVQSLMRMLKAGRIDATVFDELTAAWFIAQQPEFAPDDFYVAELPVTAVDLRFVFNNIYSWKARLPELNANIVKAKENGTIERILDHYRLTRR